MAAERRTGPTSSLNQVHVAGHLDSNMNLELLNHGSFSEKAW